jgi:predicted regulator of Ras-like GTPase activity (Roadblock/LC7/MglB family)
MASFTAGTTFVDGVSNDVTAAKLGALVTNATPTSGFIQDRTAETVIATNDTLLIGDASDSNNLKRMTVANFTQTLPTAKVTTGTIETGTFGTTTSTAATITTGTIPTLVATTLITTGTGTAAAPAIVPTGDTNTGIFFPAADTIAFSEGGTEGMRIDSSGNVGVGTASPTLKLTVASDDTLGGILVTGSNAPGIRLNDTTDGNSYSAVFAQNGGVLYISADALNTAANSSIRFEVDQVEHLRIDGSGNVLMGKTSPSTSTVGFQFDLANQKIASGANGGASAFFNRNGDDGMIVQIAQDGTVEGTISVSGTTVSYNGGNLSRFSQLPSGQRDPAIKKGTVLSNLDAMCEWRDADGNLLQNEQLNKVKISDVEGDLNTAGVFVNWDNDDQDNPYDLNMAMTGDMIIRIAQGTSVNRGDLLMSAGDGTAKPQGDDIIRSKTIAKVTSTNVTCTYEDGSYCVPCVLMAC